MKRIIFTLSLPLFFNFIFNSSSAQSCSDCRYLAPVFDSVTIENVWFGAAETIDGDTLQLTMDVYQPFGDTVSNRPLVIFAFGGAFVQGSKDDWYVVELCKMFSQAGYVAAAIDYRVGIDYLEIALGAHARIFFRPMQDYRAAIQHFKWDFAEEGNTYRIDTNRIISAGASSGAITALMVAYCNKESEADEMDIANTNPLNVLGGFYSSSGPHQNYGWNTAAVVNVAGALINCDWIEPGDIPVISAHGDADQVVPYKGGSGTSSIGFDLQGSFRVDSIAKIKGVCSYLYTMKGHDHPNEGMGLEYIRSVVYRIMFRMQAVVTDKSFCCPLSVDVTPGDTLYFGPGDPQVTLNAQLSGDSGSAQMQWCTMSCQGTSNSSSITVTPDTALHYVAAITTEGGCQASDLYITKDTTIIETAIKNIEPKIDFAVFPQPAKGSFTIKGDAGKYASNIITLQLFNLKGQRVLSRNLEPGLHLNSIIDVSELPASNYLMLLGSEGEVLGAKMVTVE